MTDIDTLERLLEQATPRPWRTDERNWRGERVIEYVMGVQCYASDGCGGTYDDSERIITTDCGHYGPKPADADLIVAAVNALPTLLRVARAAEAWKFADDEHQATKCECGGDVGCLDDCPLSLAAGRFDTRRGRLRTALDELKDSR